MHLRRRPMNRTTWLGCSRASMRQPVSRRTWSFCRKPVCRGISKSAADTGSRREVLRSIYQTAEDVRTGPSVRSLEQRARDLGLHVVYGLTERGAIPGVVYNSAVLTGPTGYIGTYRKVHLGPTEGVAWTRGDDWPVFHTAIGAIGIMICYDKAWPEAARELTLGGAEIIVVPTAWPVSREHGTSVSPDLTWEMERIRAVENGRWVVTSNYAGTIGGATYDGQNFVIDPAGRVVASSGEANASWLGERLYRDRRPETYRRLGARLPETT